MAPEKNWDRFDMSNVKHHMKRATFSSKKKRRRRKSYECGNDD